MQDPERKHHRIGFTLVELLVVIGIIALLMSFLVPALGKANAAAKRTYCLANLRNVYRAFYTYADANRGQVPLGYRIVSGNPSKQYNSMLYSATTGKFVEFGLLYKAGLMNSPAAFFCPSESNPQSMLNTSTNPWPPGSTNVNGFAGYAGRPDVVIPDDLSLAPPNSMPKWSTFKGKAILADVNTLIANLADLLATERELRIAHEVGERKLRLIFEKAESGLFVIDDRGILESWNPAFIRLLRLTPEQLPQSGITHLPQVLAPHSANLAQLIRQCLATGRSYDIDLELRIPGGKPGVEGARAIESWCASLSDDTVALVVLPVGEAGAP